MLPEAQAAPFGLPDARTGQRAGFWWHEDHVLGSHQVAAFGQRGAVHHQCYSFERRQSNAQESLKETAVEVSYSYTVTVL